MLTHAHPLTLPGPDRRFRRVVTLAGELIVESGAVSGGGQGPPRSGRMRVGTRPPVDDGAEGLEVRRDGVWVSMLRYKCQRVSWHERETCQRCSVGRCSVGAGGLD